MKKKMYQTRINAVENAQGVIISEYDQVVDHFLAYYKNLRGTRRERTLLIQKEVIEMGPVLSFPNQTMLVQLFTKEDVKKAVFSIHNCKSPGHDGYNSEFFKHSWEKVGDEVCNVVFENFEKGELGNQINHTILVLLPKNEQPRNAIEFRPIACCTVIYKIVSKMLCERLKRVLPVIVDIN